MQTFCEVNMIINNYGTVVGYLVLLKTLIPNSLVLLNVTNVVLTSTYV